MSEPESTPAAQGKTEPPDDREARIRTMQIIAGAIASGAAIFLVIAVMLRGIEAPLESPITTYVLIAIGALLVVACQVVPGLLTAAGRQKILQSTAGLGDEPLLALYQTQMIVGLALAEAAAMLAIVAFLIEGQMVSLIAALLFMGFLMAYFPTRRGVDNWLADQSELLHRDE
jgi:Cu/Ag efflux pump CusA